MMSAPPKRRCVNRSLQPRWRASLVAYRRAFARALALRHWRPGVRQTALCGAAAFVAPLALPAAAQAQFPAVFNLSDLNGDNGFVINAVGEEDYSGYSVSNAGDINGDGIDDVLIGALTRVDNSAGAGYSAGESYVVFGKQTPFSASFELSSLDGSNGFRLSGLASNDLSGRSVSDAGDVNGDGVDDIIIGAWGADGFTGESYVVFGQETPFSASLDLGSLNGTNGFVVRGNGPGDQSGFSVSGAGDVNGDGVDDIILGSPFFDDRAGKSYVVFGKQTPFAPSLNVSELNGSNGFALSGVNDGDASGFSVSSAGDVNGDEIDDLIVGARGANNRAGESYVVFGSESPFNASLDLGALNGTDGFKLTGVDDNDVSGGSVSEAGDLNGDGIGDLLIGASIASPWGVNLAGETYVVFGKETPFDASLDLGSLNGADGFVITGISEGDLSGTSVSAAGDINGDGVDDLILGAPYARGGFIGPGFPAGGESYVVFGKTTPFSTSLDLASLDGENGFALHGIGISDLSGFAVSGAGDVNGDGVDDLIIGAYCAEGCDGESYVVFGQRSIPEPGGALLAGGGLLAWLTRRRRRA